VTTGPIIDRVDSITILEPIKALRSPAVKDLALRYVDSAPSALMPFDDASFDLVTSFGVLHHIPKVTTVVDDWSASYAAEGLFVVREPIHWMGDWRRPRGGLTSRERGIPRRIFEERLKSVIRHPRELCDFPLRERIGEFDAPWNVALDAALSRLLAFKPAITLGPSGRRPGRVGVHPAEHVRHHETSAGAKGAVRVAGAFPLAFRARARRGGSKSPR
jgi:SAM-dependent methyltransferase